MAVWDAHQYLKFSAERNQPIEDLLFRLARPGFSPARIADLGCGPANSTALVARRWPQATLTGVDTSEEMLVTARRALPPATFVRENIAAWSAAPSAENRYDLVFSNSALQWVDNLGAVVPGLMTHVAPGGALAFQIPAGTDSPAAIIPRELAASPAWRPLLTAPIQEWHTQPIAFFYDRLAPRAAALDLWETEYVHIMASAEAVLEWYKGSGLRPFLQSLTTDEARARFCAACLDRYREAFPARSDGRVLFPFRRRFVIAWA